MKISGITTHLLTTRWMADPAFADALYSTAIIRISTDAGVDGLGEPTLAYFLPEAVAPIVNFFKPILIGKDPMQVARLSREMYDQCVFWGRSGAGRSVLSALEMALWDLCAKVLKVPVYQLLGGAMRERIPVYASGGPSYWPVEENVKRIAFFMDRGYRAAKLSTHFYERLYVEAGGSHRLSEVPMPFAKFVDAIASSFDAIRSAHGPEIDLAIDGHQGGVPEPIPVTEALAISDAVAPFRLRFFEEPLAYTDPDGYVELRARSKVPIAGGESLCGLDQFHALLSRGGLHVVQPDVGWAGGIGETMRIIRHAEAYNVSTAIHTGAAMGPAMAASWHIAAATQSVAWLEHVVAATEIQNEMLIEPIKLREGTVGVPTAPGLGVKLTPEILEKHPFIPNSGERT